MTAEQYLNLKRGDRVIVCIPNKYKAHCLYTSDIIDVYNDVLTPEMIAHNNKTITVTNNPKRSSIGKVRSVEIGYNWLPEWIELPYTFKEL